MEVAELQQILAKPKRIVICSHFKPDGDAIGSSLGLALILKKMGHEINVIMPSLYPEFLDGLEGSREILIFNQAIPLGVRMIEAAELIFCLDFNDLSRTNVMQPYLENASAPKVLIDHHLDPKDFADFVRSKPQASSTCEMIFDWMQEMDLGHLLDKDIANCLLTGLITDTGRFKFALSPNVFHITSKLLAVGGDIEQINRNIFDSFSEDRLRLLGFSLTERMQVFPDLKAAYIALSIEDYKKFNFKIGDNEGLVNFPLSMKDTVFSTLISETDDVIKFSFRSQGDFAVNEFAKKYFKGGGHKNASGGRYHGKFKEAIAYFEQKMKEYKETLNQEALNQTSE